MSTSTNRIDRYDFVSLVGDIGGFSRFVEQETRPGINGYTFRDLGKRGDPFLLLGKSTHSSKSAAQSQCDNFYKIQGTFVTVIKDDYSISKVMVLRVQTNIKAITGSTDGNSHMVESKWQLMRAGE